MTAMNDDDLKEAINILTASMKIHKIECDTLAKQLDLLNRQQTARQQQLDAYLEEQAIRQYSNRTLKVDWAKLFQGDPWAINKELRIQLSALMDNKPGFSWSGIDTQTLSFAFQIYISKANVCPSYLLLLKQAILTILPFIKPQTDGRIRIKLMEPSLSEYGSYNIYLADNTWSVYRGNGKTAILTSNNLDDFLGQLANNYAM